MRVSLAILTAALAAVAAARAQDFEAVERGGRLRLVIRSTVAGNLTWQLDTLAGRTQTNPKDYAALWRDQLRWSEQADANHLAAWKAAAGEHRRQPAGQSPKPPPYPANYGRYYAANLGPDYRFRIAGLSATAVPDDLDARYRALCGPACAAAFLPAVEYFRPRFLEWWQREGAAAAERFVEETRRQAATHGMVKFFEDVARLTRAGLRRGHEIGLHLVVHPKSYLTNMSGTVMDNHMLIEVVDDREIGGVRLGIVMHELTHHFYDFAPRRLHLRLIRRFAARPEPYALAAYSILNEALACALQIQWEKRLRTPAEFEAYLAKDDNIYQDPFISKAGRALAPLISERLAGGRTIHDEGFVKDYLAAVSRAFGPVLLASPRFLLSSRVAIHGPDGAAARKLFDELVRGINTQDEWAELARTPDLGGVVFLTRASAGGILERHGGVLAADSLAALREALGERAGEAFAFAVPGRPARAPLYVLYAPDAAALEQLTRRFAANDTPFSGLRVF